MLARDSNSTVPKRARGKRRADSSARTSPSKRKKSNEDNNSRSSLPVAATMRPMPVVSRNTVPSPVPNSIEPVSSNGKVTKLSSNNVSNRRKSPSAAQVLSTPPEIDTRQAADQEKRKKNQVHQAFEISDNKKSITANVSKMSAGHTSNVRHDERHGHRSGSWSIPPLFRQLFVLVIVSVFFGDLDHFFPVYQQQHSAVATGSNSTRTTATSQVSHVTFDKDFSRIPPHQATTPPLRHLLELDDYQRQQSVLAQTEKKLAKALAELADSRHELVAARAQASNAQDACTNVVLQLEESQAHLTDTQRKLDLAWMDVANTQLELERARHDLAASANNVESLTQHLNEAYQYIDELYQLLETQEMVATNALNFVATAAVKRQQEAKLTS